MITETPTAPLKSCTRVISSEDVRAVADWSAIVTALRVAYGSDIQESMTPPRGMARADGVWLRSLTAVSTSGRHVGAKLITVSTKTRNVSYVLTLMDRETAELVALIDGDQITGYRTAGTSALAADALCVPGSLRVGILGSGFEATNHLEALASVRELSAVKVFSPTAANRERFAAKVQDRFGIPAEAVASAEEAVRECDLVICAARSHDETPVLHGSWLRPGMTVVSIGSTLPEQREVDPDTIDRADVIVADVMHEVIEESGDMIAARASGVDFRDRVQPLADVIGGRAAGRTTPEQVVVYKSVGSALQDIVVAELVYERAKAQERGRIFPPFVESVIK